MSLEFGRMKENIDFLKIAVRDVKTTGSITGSSKYLIKKMLEHSALASADLVVEFGAGNGVITEAILAKLPAESKFFVFELNPDFCTRLQQINDPRLEVLNQNVIHVGEYIDAQSVDIVLSALPLSNMNEKDKNAMLESVKRCLKPNGVFVQFQYSLGDYALIKRHFSSVKLDFTLLNIPPAFIYIAQNELSF